ncbi:GIY-YIG nuclease family protein [Oceanicola sp. S124]|uniref:GIY-YIG nuclease family protein n=1 Tax=Oceanicola sp. S124 TaxID=1042378 RepID=UPI0002558153|nr:GIY-YIG nuclease family protein [Oceanicola sp. S124]
MTTGEVWIGQARDLDAIWNRQRFSLQAGGHGHRGLQQAWVSHGESAFRYEELERFEADLPAVPCRAA